MKLSDIGEAWCNFWSFLPGGRENMWQYAGGAIEILGEDVLNGITAVGGFVYELGTGLGSLVFDLTHDQTSEQTDAFVNKLTDGRVSDVYLGVNVDTAKATINELTENICKNIIEKSRADVQQSVRDLKNVKGVNKIYEKELDEKVFDEVFDNIKDAVILIAKELQEQTDAAVEFSNASDSEVFWSSMGVLTSKFAEGFLSVFESLADTIIIAGGVVASGLCYLSGNVEGAKQSEEVAGGIAKQNAVREFFDENVYKKLDSKSNVKSTGMASTGFEIGGNIAGYALLSDVANSAVTSNAAAAAGGAESVAGKEILSQGAKRVVGTVVGKGKLAGAVISQGTVVNTGLAVSTVFGASTANSLREGKGFWTSVVDGTGDSVAVGAVSMGVGMAGDNSGKIIDNLNNKYAEQNEWWENKTHMDQHLQEAKAGITEFKQDIKDYASKMRQKMYDSIDLGEPKNLGISAAAESTDDALKAAVDKTDDALKAAVDKTDDALKTAADKLDDANEVLKKIGIKENTPFDEMADKVDDAVREGKITPKQRDDILNRMVDTEENNNLINKLENRLKEAEKSLSEAQEKVDALRADTPNNHNLEGMDDYSKNWTKEYLKASEELQQAKGKYLQVESALDDAKAGKSVNWVDKVDDSLGNTAGKARPTLDEPEYIETAEGRLGYDYEFEAGKPGDNLAKVADKLDDADDALKRIGITEKDDMMTALEKIDDAQTQGKITPEEAKIITEQADAKYNFSDKSEIARLQNENAVNEGYKQSNIAKREELRVKDNAKPENLRGHDEAVRQLDSAIDSNNKEITRLQERINSNAPKTGETVAKVADKLDDANEALKKIGIKENASFEDVAEKVDDAVRKGQLTPDQRDNILNKFVDKEETIQTLNNNYNDAVKKHMDIIKNGSADADVQTSLKNMDNAEMKLKAYELASSETTEDLNKTYSDMIKKHNSLIQNGGTDAEIQASLKNMETYSTALGMKDGTIKAVTAEIPAASATPAIATISHPALSSVGHGIQNVISGGVNYELMHGNETPAMAQLPKMQVSIPDTIPPTSPFTIPPVPPTDVEPVITEPTPTPPPGPSRGTGYRNWDPTPSTEIVTEPPTELPTEIITQPSTEYRIEEPTIPSQHNIPTNNYYYTGRQSHGGEMSEIATEIPTVDEDVIVRGNTYKLPTSSKMPVTTPQTTARGNAIIPVLAGLGAAAAAGIGAKTYLERKNNTDNESDDEFNTEDWSDNGELSIDYNEPKEETLDDDEYVATEPERYGARTSQELENIQ